LVRQAFPLFFGRPFGITATNAGVEYRTELGGRRFLRWEEIRLLEVRYSSRDSRNYMLYGTRMSVGWTENEGVIAWRDFAPAGMTLEEMTYRLQALLDLIGARTGFRPRTFSKRLQAKPEAGVASLASQPGTSSVSDALVWRAALLIAFAAAPVALAIAVLQVPFSGIQPLNDVIAASLFLTALLTVGFAIWAVVVTRRMPQTAGEYVAVSAPPSGFETTKYVLVFAIHGVLRVVFIILGILLCLDALPFAAPAVGNLVYSAVEPVLRDFDRTLGHIESPSFGMVLGCVMIPFAVFGLAFIWTGLRFATATILVDARGLTTHARRQQRTLLWELVEQLTATRKGDRIVGYTAKGGTVEISWPANLVRQHASAHSGDIMPITPDELVALAAARTGKPVSLMTVSKPDNAR
jgi:hypothetical protein